MTYSRLTSLSESMVCLCDEFSKWHSRECLLGGECKSCGIDNFPNCPVEEEGLCDLMVN